MEAQQEEANVFTREETVAQSQQEFYQQSAAPVENQEVAAPSSQGVIEPKEIIAENLAKQESNNTQEKKKLDKEDLKTNGMWKCHCGNENVGKFCTNCGSKQNEVKGE